MSANSVENADRTGCVNASTDRLNHAPRVSLTFDDGLAQHLDVAMPILNSHGMPATFYVHLAAPDFGPRISDWIKAAEAGHEIGNHTILHPADESKSYISEGNSLNRYSLDRMRVELDAANAVLSGLDGRPDRTFAYPCSNNRLGQQGIVRRFVRRLGFDRTRLASWADALPFDPGRTLQNYSSLMKDRFVAARGGGLIKGQSIPPLKTFDRYRLLSCAVDDSWSAEELIHHTQNGIDSGTWTILQFHGVAGGHHMNCSEATFRTLINWLAESEVKVETIRQSAKRIWNSETVSVESRSLR